MGTILAKWLTVTNWSVLVFTLLCMENSKSLLPLVYGYYKKGRHLILFYTQFASGLLNLSNWKLNVLLFFTLKLNLVDLGRFFEQYHLNIYTPKVYSMDCKNSTEIYYRCCAQCSYFNPLFLPWRMNYTFIIFSAQLEIL